MNCLVIGSVWPEPKSSAAGENMLALLHGALRSGWDVTFCSAAQPSVHAVNLCDMGIKQKSILLNDSSFDSFVKTLRPSIVIFDRFMTEEQFGWRVSKALPEALRVLNTEDLHGLRKQTQLSTHENNLETAGFNDIMLREVSSILRCDLTLIISQSEIDWLTKNASVNLSQLHYFPLLPTTNKHLPSSFSFDKRQHISFIGNFKHLPNWHAVLYLRKLWPQVRSALPHAQCHIFGAYPPKKATDLSNEKFGFLVKGWIDDADEAFSSYRLSVAPLPFGAGVKGKLIRAIANGVPSVVSRLATQGICDEATWPGIVARNDKEFVDAIVLLYTNEEVWAQHSRQARELHTRLRLEKVNHQAFYKNCEHLLKDNQLETFRSQHLLTQVLNHHTLKSHQYMSQWIEAKNQIKN